MDKIIISATAFGIKHTIELSDDSGIEDFFVAFKSLLIGITFNEVVIDNHIKELAETL
jgi:hypothetical protein